MILCESSDVKGDNARGARGIRGTAAWALRVPTGYGPWLCGIGLAYTALMVRIQFRIPQDEHDAAKREAERLGISLAEFVRRAVRSALPAESSRPWMRYAGMVESGDPASSRHIHDVLGW
jgi:hypothetical protein